MLSVQLKKGSWVLSLLIAQSAWAIGVTQMPQASGPTQLQSSSMSTNWSSPVQAALPSVKQIQSTEMNLAVPGAMQMESTQWCGDGDATNFFNGVATYTGGAGKNVSHVNGNVGSLPVVLGYWLVKQSAVQAASAGFTGTTVPNPPSLVPVTGNSGDAIWFPIAYSTGSVPVTSSGGSNTASLSYIHGGQGPANTFFSQKVQSLVNQAGNSYNSRVPGYAAYFALQACLPAGGSTAGYNLTGNGFSGTNPGGGDSPDSLDIIDFVNGNASTNSQQSVSSALSGYSAHQMANKSQYNLQFNHSSGFTMTLGGGGGFGNAGGNALYQLGQNLATTNWANVTQTNQIPGLGSLNTLAGHLASDAGGGTNCPNDPSVSPGEMQRWFETYKMNLACQALVGTGGNYSYLQSLVTKVKGDVSGQGTWQGNVGALIGAQQTLQGYQHSLTAALDALYGQLQPADQATLSSDQSSADGLQHTVDGEVPAPNNATVAQLQGITNDETGPAGLNAAQTKYWNDMNAIITGNPAYSALSTTGVTSAQSPIGGPSGALVAVTNDQTNLGSPPTDPTNDANTLASVLMTAGFTQQVENDIGQITGPGYTQPTTRCFVAGTPNGYIDSLAASIVIPFQNVSNSIQAFPPGAMTHPEGLFALEAFPDDYQNNNFIAVFGMAAPTTSFTPANPGSSSEAGTPVGNAEVAAANYYIPLSPGSASNPTLSNVQALIQGAIDINMNLRGICPCTGATCFCQYTPKKHSFFD